MKTRIAAARFIEHQLSNKTGVVPDAKPDIYCDSWHYGLMELKQLMDYIYELPAIYPEYILKANIDEIDNKD